ncbi:MAG: FecR family protein [Rudaea sp.]|uniref:FecR family protein n=1 Tax=Rudaea sp. TaxID=2136325 RepID=UPI0039E4CBA5
MNSDRSDAAEHWFQRMHAADCTPAERAAFEQWRAEYPGHADAYARTEHLYHRAAELRFDPQWRAMARAARQRTARRARVRHGLLWGLPLAAMLVLALGAGWFAWDPKEPPQHYATAVGERRTLTLADGSSVVLDTDSALAVNYSRSQRRLILERGRAQFSVQPQPQRPFIVSVDQGSVRAVGTEFQISRRAANVQVILLKGVVTVSAPAETAAGQERTATLAAGEQLNFDAGPLWAKKTADVDAAKGWTHGELKFDRRPLADVVEEMNRYSAVKIRLGDPTLKDLPVSGAFYDNDQNSLVQALQLGWSLRADRTSPTEITLRRRD